MVEDASEDESVVFPISSEITIKAHDKRVTALSTNPKASRMATGAMDGLVRIWDFNGMTTAFRWCRSVSPADDKGITNLLYSRTGNSFLCTAGDSIIYQLDVDGNELNKTVGGDMYIRDLNHTKGHTHAITSFEWHPYNHEYFLSSSNDSSVRIWDINTKPYGVTQSLPHLYCLKAVDKRNLTMTKVHVNVAKWYPSDGKTIITGCANGSLQIWNEKKVYSKPDKVIWDAHGSNPIEGILFTSFDTFLTRSCETLKAWDVRNLKEHIHQWDQMFNYSGNQDMCVDSTGHYGVIAVSQNRNNGFLKFIDLEAKDIIQEVSFGSSAPLKVEWPEEINQIIVTFHNGSVKVLYDEQTSSKGALLALKNAPREKIAAVHTFDEPVFTPADLPEGFKETRTGEIRQLRKKEMANLASKKQRIGPLNTSVPQVFPTSQNLAQFLMGQMSKCNSEAALDKAKNSNPLVVDTSIFVSDRYKLNQPIAIFKDEEDEEYEELSRKCPRCGLKLCQCGYMEAQKVKQELYGKK